MVPAPIVHVSLLDGFLVQIGDQFGNLIDAEDLPHGVQRLVAHLSLCSRAARSAIAGELWPEFSENQAQRNLRTALWRLQKTVPGLVHSSGGALTLARGTRVDAQDLSSWAQRMVRATGRDDELSLNAAARAELLPGWYDDWVLTERERLHQLCMHACEALADRLTRAGRFGEAVEAAIAAIRADPLRESAHRVLIRIHVAEGNEEQALIAYERFRALIAEELGLQPSEQMDRLLEPSHRRPLRRLRPL